MMTATAARPVKTIAYETTECTRCGGTGRMPYAAYGGVCFGCTGKGVKMTRAGRAAKQKVDAYAAAHMTVAASSLKPGDKILDKGARRTVVDVSTTLGKGNGSMKQGVEGTDSFMEVWNFGQTILTTQKVSFCYPAHYPVTIAWTRDHLTAAAATVAHLKGAIVTYADDTA